MNDIDKTIDNLELVLDTKNQSNFNFYLNQMNAVKQEIYYDYIENGMKARFFQLIKNELHSFRTNQILNHLLKDIFIKHGKMGRYRFRIYP